VSGEQLTALKEQLARLTPEEKLEVARFLEEDAARELSPFGEPCGDPDNDQKRARRMAWLKAHREEYAGQYVGLDGDRLVGSGATIRQAHDQAISHGVEHPFLTHISSASDAPFGGW
jgi:hypothetical protein